jgi:hypothetical protein
MPGVISTGGVGGGVTQGLSMPGVTTSWRGAVVTQGLLPPNAKKVSIAASPMIANFSMGFIFNGSTSMITSQSYNPAPAGTILMYVTLLLQNDPDQTYAEPIQPMF